MDIQFPFNFISLLLFISLIFSLIKLWKKSKNPKTNKKLPPSPPELPLIGHLHHLLGSALPHVSIRKLSQKYGPIMYLKLGEVPAVIISSPELAKHALKLHDPSCADRPQSIVSEIMYYHSTDIAFSPYGAYWKQMREICIFEMLSPKNVRSFGWIRIDESARLIESVRGYSGRVIDLTDKFFAYSSSITCRVVFGGLLRDRDTLIMFVKEAISLSGGFEFIDFFPSLKLLPFVNNWSTSNLSRMRSKLDKILDEVIDEHKNRPGINGELGEDIVDVLLRLKQTGELNPPITADNIKSIIFDMFSGGTQTSSTALEWAMSELIKNPRVMTKLQDEIRRVCKEKKTVEESDIHQLKYLKLVIKETLRLHPPVALLPRGCRQEVEVNGYTIPLHAKVFISVWSMARDPIYWLEPESFKPERFENNSIEFTGNNFEYLPFGAGSRMCPGRNFGLANVELPLAQLLYHFDWALPTMGMNNGDLDMTEEKGLAVARKFSLLLVPTPYKPPSEA